MSSDIQRAVQLATLLVKSQSDVAALELELAEAKAAVQRLEQEDLPELMQELGLASFKLEDGASVDLTQDVFCGITEARRASAHKWLLDNGFGGLIKTQVVAEFGKGELDAANEAARTIGGTVKEAVHPATLKSFVKEQLAKGSPLPTELFGINPFNKIKITLKK